LSSSFRPPTACNRSPFMNSFDQHERRTRIDLLPVD
jgi:hypothetical protein